MTRLWRLILAAALPLLAASGGLLMADKAQAQSVASGSLTFGGDTADWITQGESESFSTSNGDPLVVSTSTNNPGNEVGVRVFINASEWWDLEIAAGGTAVLAPGTYAGATRYPLNTSSPGLNLDGNGRGCNTLTGSFTVIDAVFGPQGYVQKFDATFVQHCEGAAAAATGAVHISNPPPPVAAPAQQPVATGTQGGAGSAPPAAAAGGAASGSRSVTGSPAATAYAGSIGAAVTAARHIGSNTPVLLRRSVNMPLLVGAGIASWVVIAAIALGIGLGVHLSRRANWPTAQTSHDQHPDR